MPVIALCEGLAHEGAVANVAWHQAIGLAQSQPVCVISDGLSAERRGRLPKLGEALRVRVVHIPSLQTLRRFAHLPRQLIWIALALRATGRELGQCRGVITPVICHSHPLAAAVGWCFGTRVRLVMVSHGDVFHRPPGSYDPAITWLYRRTTRPAHRLAAVNVALSPVMSERIEVHGVPAERIVLIPNGLNPAEIGLSARPYTPADHWRERPLQLLFVGRMDPVKGVDVLLDALALMHDRGLDVQLDLIGRASPSQSRDLDGRTRKLGLGDRVQRLGPRARRELAGHYARCHMVVVPSRDDPLPTVVLEAMACGRAVIGSAVGGIGFLVADGVTGVLVPPGQPGALADVLARLDADRTALETLAGNALRRGAQFSWEANVEALQRLITASAM